MLKGVFEVPKSFWIALRTRAGRAVLFIAVIAVSATNILADTITAQTFFYLDTPMATERITTGSPGTSTSDTFNNGFGQYSAAAMGALVTGSVSTNASLSDIHQPDDLYLSSYLNSSVVMTYDFTLTGVPPSGRLLLWGMPRTSTTSLVLTGCGPYCIPTNSFAETFLLGTPDELISENSYAVNHGTVMDGTPIVMSIPFVGSGVVFEFTLESIVGCYMGIPPLIACSASSGATFDILGAEVFDNDGALVPNASVVSDSGFAPPVADFGIQPVPETASIISLATVLMIVAFAKRCGFERICETTSTNGASCSLRDEEAYPGGPSREDCRSRW